MEKEVFVKIINALVELNRISEGLNNVLDYPVNCGMDQVNQIVEALEIQFEDDEKWINWWLFEAGEKKEIIREVTPIRPVKNVEDTWEIHETQEVKLELATAGDLYDWLDWNMANS